MSMENKPVRGSLNFRFFLMLIYAFGQKIYAF